MVSRAQEEKRFLSDGARLEVENENESGGDRDAMSVGIRPIAGVVWILGKRRVHQAVDEEEWPSLVEARSATESCPPWHFRRGLDAQSPDGMQPRCGHR